MQQLRIAFFGNTKYSVIVVRTLYNEYGLSSIVTIPDRPLGRKKILTPSPVKQFALENNVPVLTIERFNNETIQQSNNIDFFVVADYGLILPKNVLTLPKYAALNVHHSLLPKYRGPSPAPTAILNGDKVSGVSIIRMIEQVDAGPILAQKEYTLKADETTDSLLTRLNTLGGELVVDVIKNYEAIKPMPQDESKASLTNRMSKQDGYIDLENPPPNDKLDRMIRAFYPWPTVWTKVVIRSHLDQGETLQKEQIVKFLPQKGTPFEAKVQVEGGKPMSVKDFLNGYPEMKGKIENILPKP